MMPSTDWSSEVKAHLHRSAETHYQAAEKCTDSILVAASMIVESFRSDGKVLLCGNGGSAADCQHMAAEFVNRLTKDFERRALPAIALTTDSSFVTAFANDYGFDGIFERQVRALGKPGDVLIGISTSGNSKNVVRGVNAARELHLKTIGLLGGGELAERVDCPIVIPSQNTQHVQEVLLSVEHIICYLVERIFFLEK